MLANTGTAPALSLNPALRNHRPAGKRGRVAVYTTQYDKVAEVPDEQPRAARRAGRTAARSSARALARPVAYKATRPTVRQVSGKQAPVRAVPAMPRHRG